MLQIFMKFIYNIKSFDFFLLELDAVKNYLTIKEKICQQIGSLIILFLCKLCILFLAQ